MIIIVQVSEQSGSQSSCSQEASLQRLTQEPARPRRKPQQKICNTWTISHGRCFRIWRAHQARSCGVAAPLDSARQLSAKNPLALLAAHMAQHVVASGRLVRRLRTPARPHARQPVSHDRQHGRGEEAGGAGSTSAATITVTYTNQTDSRTGSPVLPMGGINGTHMRLKGRSRVMKRPAALRPMAFVKAAQQQRVGAAA